MCTQFTFILIQVDSNGVKAPATLRHNNGPRESSFGLFELILCVATRTESTCCIWSKYLNRYR